MTPRSSPPIATGLRKVSRRERGVIKIERASLYHNSAVHCTIKMAITTLVLKERLRRLGKTQGKQREIQLMKHFKKLNNNNSGTVIRFSQGTKIGMKKWSQRSGYTNKVTCKLLCECRECDPASFASDSDVGKALQIMESREKELQTRISLSSLSEKAKRKALARSAKRFKQEKLDLRNSESLAINKQFVARILRTGLPGLEWEDFKSLCGLPENFTFMK